MNHPIAQTIRKLTLAPLLAAVMLIFLYAVQPEILGSAEVLFRQLFFLSLFPLLAYPCLLYTSPSPPSRWFRLSETKAGTGSGISL